MIVLAGFVIGALLGARIALKRGGRRLDALHYATAFAIVFGLIGLFLTIFVERMAS